MPVDDVIVVNDLVRSFGPKGNEKNAVDHISFEVKKGEIFGILGPNGAGKTTTIKMLSTLLIPTSGTAMVLGHNVTDKSSVRELRKRVNVVSGGERGLYYRLTGRQNMQYFADLYGVPRKEQKELIDRLLALVGMTEAADRRVEEYSRGMKQRVHIARALVNEPEVLFLDEPTIGLDPEISLDIRNLIRKLSDSGTTIILTTHYMFEAEELCDRMIIISHGRIVGYGTVPELKQKVHETDMIRIVTSSDPSGQITAVSAIDGVENVRTEMVGGRFTVSVQTAKGKDPLRELESLFEPDGVRSIGHDEPTLEDVYLHLVGGE
jgi:ABC-2 type transport system ATP-binding protein